MRYPENKHLKEYQNPPIYYTQIYSCVFPFNFSNFFILTCNKVTITDDKLLSNVNIDHSFYFDQSINK